MVITPIQLNLSLLMNLAKSSIPTWQGPTFNMQENPWNNNLINRFFTFSNQQNIVLAKKINMAM